MRLSNRHKAGMYSFINSAAVLFAMGSLAGFLMERYKFKILGLEKYVLIIIPIVILLIIYLRGRQIFEYDSDGEALNFKNRNVIPLLNKSASDEFPKYKLLKYEVVNGIFFKRLYITISSKKGHPIILKYDISYLTKKELGDLRHSLSKTVRANAEQRKMSQENK